ncbi:MAG: hypothetical protein QGH48_00015 [Candidatus Poseidoniia archaeon]|jgi:hypothetical protein|nr:hypothetical protein [Candidatus Poseidoniia archaeon]MDP7444123.1 hypothetical protein [Candidatus Poseidoniia archaeon]HJL71495.1 hypothetical protein [Candidatus Poseidoniia archaeon]|tara:strand:- start:703 stop:1410 length:708 start_codon:yes stop_codon:yes gene_type:complete
MEMSVLLVIFLVLILSIALYYGLLGVDMGTINDDYVIPVAILFLLITTGGFAGNNGFTGDFGLDYCNDKDSITNSIVENIREQVSYDETERAVVHSNSFFACELGYINGVVDLGWWVSSFTNGQTVGSGRAMILNHENYKNFVNGETYGFSNFYLSDLESPLGSGETSKYKVGITLHSDTYFFVVDRGYGTNIGGEETGRDLFGPNSPTGSTADPIYFYYVVDLDYDTSGVVTTN